MPPLLALVLCSGFVIWILRYDRKQQNHVSKALWLPTIWMFSIATKPLAIWFRIGGTGNAESGSPVDRIFQLVLLCAGLMILTRRKLNWSWVFRENAWLIALLSYMLISVCWSDIPFSSFKRWTRALTAVVMALVVLTEAEPGRAIESILRRTTYILIPFSILVIKYYPRYGRGYAKSSGGEMWSGVALQKNGLGVLCMVAAFFLIWTLIRRWQGRDKSVARYQTITEIFLLLLTFRLMAGAGAYSATALVSLTAGVVTFLTVYWMKARGIRLGQATLTAVVVSIIFVGVITPWVQGSFLAGFTSTVGRDATFTGRTGIWAGVLPYARQKPLFGYGFGGFWTSDMISDQVINEAHNAYLDIFLQLGTIGVFLATMFWISFAARARRALHDNFDFGILSLCFLIMSLLHGITESSIDDFTRHLMANLVFLSVVLPYAVAPETATEERWRADIPLAATR